MNDIESLAYKILKDTYMTDKEISDFRTAADHHIECKCKLCENFHKLMPKEKNEY